MQLVSRPRSSFARNETVSNNENVPSLPTVIGSTEGKAERRHRDEALRDAHVAARRPSGTTDGDLLTVEELRRRRRDEPGRGQRNAPVEEREARARATTTSKLDRRSTTTSSHPAPSRVAQSTRSVNSRSVRCTGNVVENTPDASGTVSVISLRSRTAPGR